MTDTTNLIGLAIDKNPVDFADAVDTILRSKAAEALEAKKIELAQSIYGGSETEDVDDGISDDDDIDFDDLYLDDIDLDLDDLDLETEDGTDDNS